MSRAPKLPPELSLLCTDRAEGTDDMFSIVIDRVRYVGATSGSALVLVEALPRAPIAHRVGSAIAIADSLGVDVEEFVRELRAHEPKPPVLVPPKSGAS